MHRLFAAATMVVLMTAAAFADEYPPKHAGAQSGVPLTYYCTHVPDLSVNRPDAADTWVKICTVYFKAQPNRPAPGGPDGPNAQQAPNNQGPRAR